MGLWLKQGDDLVPVGGGGGGGSFDGEHVLTGDPLNPPDELQVGQLLYDGDPSTGGGGGTFDGEHVPTGDPSDPATLDIVDEGQLLFDGVENDGSDGGPHDHDDYLPLTGGTLTGNLDVDGQLDVGGPTVLGDNLWVNDQIIKDVDHLEGRYFRGRADGVVGFPTYSWDDDPTTGLYLVGSGTMGAAGDLQVDGRIQAYTGVTPDNPAIKFDAGTGMYRKGTHQIGFAINGVLVASIDSGGVHGRMAFGIAEGIDTQDVLERAEVATMPAPADDGVVTADVESLTVNEVMTAMLAKIKELSAEIEELKGA